MWFFLKNSNAFRQKHRIQSIKLIYFLWLTVDSVTLVKCTRKQNEKPCSNFTKRRKKYTWLLGLEIAFANGTYHNIVKCVYVWCSEKRIFEFRTYFWPPRERLKIQIHWTHHKQTYIQPAKVTRIILVILSSGKKFQSNLDSAGFIV